MSRIPANRLFVFVLLASVALTVDLYTKSIVFNDLGYPGAEPTPSALGQHHRFAAPASREGESVPYIDGWMTFRLLTSFNRGALWGLGQEYTWLFAGLSLAAVIGIPVWLFAFSAARSLWLTIALALILGGTLGNLYDRIGLHGCRDSQGAPIAAVRDFLLFTFGGFHWPVFNFADVFLVSGAAMLVLHSLFPVRSETAGTQAADVAAPAKTAQAASTSAPAVATLPSPPTR
ncbi:MAG TPA: signal peptidase II [Planctomycetaceae bacterium]|jgi:signal peptidase II|nr:signal peptidase II [Planctomycetaceae bacterium]